MRVEIHGLTGKEKKVMNWLAKIVIVWTLAIVLIQIGILHGRKLERICWEKALNEIITEYQRLEILEKIIRAESNGRHKGIWGANGEFGICQFKQETFYFLADKADLPNPDWEDQVQQIALLNWAIENGMGNHWTTFEKVKGEKNE